MPGAPEWLADNIGHKYARIEGFGLDPVRRIHFPANGGREVIQNLENYLKEKGVEILTETPAKELRTNDDGDVIGVVAEGPDGEKIVIEAKKVILATGGFARNEDLLARFVPEAKGTSELTVAAAGSTGDGILMAEKVGAVLYEEPWIIGMGIGTRIEGTGAIGMDWTKLYVNGEGKRFANEQMHYAIATNKIIEEDVVWVVLDSAEANADIIASLEKAMPTDEVAKAESFAELAEAMDVPVDNFVATVEEYNQGAKTGKDAMGKEPEHVVAVEKAPFYAVKAYPKTMGTFGGVKTDEHFRVLREDGSVINNLYAGGECANKILYNQVYISGSAVQFALTSGRIAGEHAAKNLD
jgi:succinate dehydrogenase/fumarate reductase flavoprotein subunit